MNLYLHETITRTQCACGLILEAGKLVIKDSETGKVMGCKGCRRSFTPWP